MKRKDYKAVKDIVRESGNYAAYIMIAGIEHPVDQIEEMFLTAARNIDDKESSKYFSWLMHAIDDLMLVPLIDGKKELQNETMGEAKEAHRTQCTQEQAEDTAMKLRSTRVMALYGDLWKIGEEEKVNKKWLTHPAILMWTKEQMLTEVVHRWRDTIDEDEADCIFSFFLSLISRSAGFDRLSKHREREVLVKAVRKAFDQPFPPSRIVRHLTKLNTVGYDERVYGARGEPLKNATTFEIEKILAINWVRNTNIERVVRTIGATEPIGGGSKHSYPVGEAGSSSSFSLLKKLASEIESLDGKARLLKNQMWGNRLNFSLNDDERELARTLERNGYVDIPGGIKISYPSLSSLDVCIQGTTSEFGLHEEGWHDWFNHIKKHVFRWKVERWCRDGQRYAVKIRMIVQTPYSIVFMRDEEL